MKLHAEKRTTPHCGTQPLARRDGVGRLDHVGVREIIRVAPGLDHRPAESRNARRVQTNDEAFEESQTLHSPVFLARLEGELHPEADPQDRLVRDESITQRQVGAGLAQVFHGATRRTHAGQDDVGSGGDEFRVGADVTGTTEVRQGRAHRAGVARSVVDHNDVAHNEPFVERMSEPSRTSA